MSLMPGARVGPYEIVSSLGAGGMGEVFLGRDSRLDRRVAIKGLPQHLIDDPIARERLRREARAAAALDHPFICKVFELWEDHGGALVVMEFVDGETLHERLRGGALPLSEGLRIAAEIADALEAAHAQRIVHRDLKPSNVMLTRQSRVKVMDFGLARQAAGAIETIAAATGRAPLTEDGTRVGTPDYMSPEQAVGDAVDERSDLFSFGILVCEMLTGVHPFRRAASGSTLAAIIRESPSFNSGATALPPSVAVILRRLLAKLPADRYQSVSEVRRDLAALSGLSSSARVVPTMGRASMRFPLVGRDAERSELLAGLDAAVGGRGSMVVISGEPGIGKTRLTADVLAEARHRGFFCLVGHCYEMEGAPPYVPFVEMLEYSARYVPPSAFRHALGDAGSAVSKLMPELRRLFPDIAEPPVLPPEQQRRFLFNAYLEFVERSCRTTPIAVVLEDLHWADEPTLMLVQHIAQACASIPIFIMATYRDVELEVTRPFSRTLEALLRERRATRLTLRRLPVEAVETMLTSMSGQTPPPSLARVIFDETEGNPFFVEEVFQHLAEEGKLFDESGSWRRDLRVRSLEVPEGVRLVIGRRLQRLGDRTRATLTTAAIVGRTFSLRLLEAMDPNPDGVIDAIEEAERAQLVAVEPSGRDPRYRFAHELIRQTLADGLSLPRRQRQHRRIAEAMECIHAATLDKYAPALAHHLYQAGAAADPDKTTKWLLTAAAQARAANGFEESLAHLDNALSLWEGVQSAIVADILAERALALRSLGRASESIETSRRAVAIYEALDQIDDATSAGILLAWTLLWEANPTETARVTERLERLGSRNPVLHCRLLLTKAMAVGGIGRTTEAFEALEHAEAVRESVDDQLLESESRTIACHLNWSAMRLDRATELARELSERAAAAGDWYGFAETRWIEGGAHVHSGRPAAAKALLEDLMPRAERAGHYRVAWVCRSFLCVLRFAAGDLEDARRLSESTTAFAAQYDIPWAFFDEALRGVLAMCGGDAKAATRHLCAAIAMQPPTYWDGIAHAYLFLHQAFQKDPAALERLTHTPEMPVPGRLARGGSWVSVAPIARGFAALGDKARLAALVPAAESLLTAGLVGYYWGVKTTAALAFAAANNWTAAEELHRRAIDEADAIPQGSWQADARDWYAHDLIERGATDDVDRARALLSDVAARYSAMGAHFLAARARQRLAFL